MQERSLSLGSGRRLQLVEGGDPRGVPVIALHGTPGSRLLHPKHVEDAAAHGIRLIGYDRAGYGGSTPVPGRPVVDAATEVRAIADHLALDRVAVWGHSGGGAPALACAATLGRRIVAAASLAGVAPYPAEGLDWASGMGELNAEDFRLLVRDRAAWEKKVEKDREELLAANPEGLRTVLASLLSPVDRELLTDELARFLLLQAHEGLKHGPEGMRDDGVSQILPWGFDPASIRVPLQLWHGAGDRFVPFAHGEWLASRLPGAEVHLEADEGHVSLFVRRIPEVQRWLASKF